MNPNQEVPPQSRPGDWVSKVAVPAFGTFASIFAALLSGFLVWFTNDKTSQIQEHLSTIQREQFASEQATKKWQFTQDSERQYVVLVYNDLLSKDAARQLATLSLLQVLVPETGLKLLKWAKEAQVILPENKAASERVAATLMDLQTKSTYRLFLHLGSTKGRPVPEASAIKRALETEGYAVLGVDDRSDEFGPGVDYFNENDKQAAESIARVLRGLMPDTAPAISARKQRGPSRQGTLGLWF